MEARQWLFRARAEALLADIKSLELNRSSWSDAQRLMNRWGKWGGWYGSCNPQECRYSIQIYHLLSIYPPNEGPHIGARILESVGLRSGRATAIIVVSRGVITSKEFGLDATLPVNQWITRFENGTSSYWPSVQAAVWEGVEIQSTPFQITEHPNRSVVLRRTVLEASFTPNESLHEQATLTDFQFGCITRWTPCTTWGELLPRAAQQFEADSQQSHSQ